MEGAGDHDRRLLLLVEGRRRDRRRQQGEPDITDPASMEVRLQAMALQGKQNSNDNRLYFLLLSLIDWVFPMVYDSRDMEIYQGRAIPGARPLRRAPSPEQLADGTRAIKRSGSSRPQRRRHRLQRRQPRATRLADQTRSGHQPDAGSLLTPRESLARGEAWPPARAVPSLYRVESVGRRAAGQGRERARGRESRALWRGSNYSYVDYNPWMIGKPCPRDRAQAMGRVERQRHAATWLGALGRHPQAHRRRRRVAGVSRHDEGRRRAARDHGRHPRHHRRPERLPREDETYVAEEARDAVSAGSSVLIPLAVIVSVVYLAGRR